MNQQNNLIETTKLAICFRIPERVKDELADTACQVDDMILSPVLASNLHMTALYLGHVVSSTIPLVKEILQNTASAQRSFHLKNGRPLVMHPDEPYMLWIRYDKDRWHEEVVTSLENIFWRIGTWKGSRDRKQRKQSGDKYSQAHVTLAYAREGRLLESLNPGIELSPSLEKLPINEVELVSIDGKGEQTTYTILDIFPLGK